LLHQATIAALCAKSTPAFLNAEDEDLSIGRVQGSEPWIGINLLILSKFIDLWIFMDSSSGIAAASNPFQVSTWKADSRIAFTASPMAFSSLACTSSFLGCKETTAVPPKNKTDKLPTNLTKPERQHPFPIQSQQCQQEAERLCFDQSARISAPPSIVMPCHGKSRKESKV